VRLSFLDAKIMYPHRYTMEHVPNWAFRPIKGKYHAPQYRTDREWYENTIFPGEDQHHGFGSDCYSAGGSWPLGLWLDRPYRGQSGQMCSRDEGTPIPIHEAIALSRASDHAVMG
jgi:hypothetical protein